MSSSASKPPRPPSSASISSTSSDRNRRLRHLTQAYLSPLQHGGKPRVVENTLNRVDQVYDLTRKLIGEYQSVTTGLFPRYSIDTGTGYVKDSIYCALACWSCSIAYKRLDDDRGRQTELCQTAVKTMRGILFCWMQQVEKVNGFKQNNSPEFSLHSRFDLHTGIEFSQPFSHLQMDLVALYILILVEMTVGGTQIIYTSHEVAFLQNLVFYIERTYRTQGLLDKDFGMWERGNRYNTGVPELHASSLGLVKAALESVNGFNAYGSSGTSDSVIYVDIDGHNRNRTTFETVLPRESNSKNTDAALLLAVGWPAFATHDEKLYESTLNKCVRHLEGRYGLRRFLRDGYRTECEDPTKRHYEEEETYKFQGIENQFPMFLACISLTAQFRGNQALSDRYWAKFKSLLVPGDFSGLLVLPECYCIDEDHMKIERELPNTQDFYALNPLEFGHHLWSNAIYIIALLIREKLIHLSDIDPIYRHLPASQRPKYVNRHSAFHGSMEGNPVVQIALIAESVQLQMMLATYGISTQTPHEVEPVQIWPSWRMVKVFEYLGKDKKMNLSGRPARPFGPLNTSKIFRVCGDTVICYPLLFELNDFYINADPSTLIEDIKRDIEFVSRRWKLAGRPTFCMVLREENVVGEYFDNMLDLLVSLKNGFVNGIRVRIGRIHQLLNTGCLEHIDFVNPNEIDFSVEVFEEVAAKEAHLKSKATLRPIPPVDSNRREKEFRSMDDHTLFQIIAKNDLENLRVVAFAISIMQKRYTSGFVVHGETLAVRMDKVYRQACQWRQWWLIRYCAAKLRKTITSLAPGITSLLVRGKQVILGMKTCVEITIGSPSTPVEIANAIFSSYHEDEPHAAVLQQELIIACADLIAHKPDSFDGVLAIRLSWLTEALELLLNFIKDSVSKKDAYKEGYAKPLDLISFLDGTSPASVVRQFDLKHDVGVYDLPPTLVKDLLAALITKKNWHLLTPLQTRKLNGALNRVPLNLYDRVWKILERVKDGIVIAGHVLPQEPTLKSMMGDIAHPEYRQLLVELLCIVATIMERNPEIFFVDAFNCDHMIKQAFSVFCEERRIRDRVDMTPFYELDESAIGSSTSSYLIRVVVDKLLKDSNIRHKFSVLGDDAASDLIMSGERKNDDTCYVS
uniref:Phosphorylase b kinase regulatory subunit n=1 Tax=Ditylenchus dipsaci TaxID=166011 RepID=A0A915E5Y7_9BILA